FAFTHQKSKALDRRLLIFVVASPRLGKDGDGRGEGQLHEECGALPLARALRPDPPAMQLHELTRDGQAEPQSRRGLATARIGLAESLEDVREKLGDNSLAVVL